MRALVVSAIKNSLRNGYLVGLLTWPSCGACGRASGALGPFLWVGLSVRDGDSCLPYRSLRDADSRQHGCSLPTSRTRTLGTSSLQMTPRAVGLCSTIQWLSYSAASTVGTKCFSMT